MIKPNEGRSLYYVKKDRDSFDSLDDSVEVVVSDKKPKRARIQSTSDRYTIDEKKNMWKNFKLKNSKAILKKIMP